VKTTPEIAHLLASQFGVVSRAQLVALGVSTRTIDRWRSMGALVELLPGIYRSVATPGSFEARAMAVQLYAAPDGALSGPTAAHLFGIRGMPRSSTWATVWRRIQADLPRWAALTRSSWLDPFTDVVCVNGCFRVLRAPVMLLTLAELFNDHRFERAAEDAWHLRLVDPHEAAAFLDKIRGQGRAGVARFARWLDKTGARERPSQSGFELDVLDAVLRAGLPQPQRQHPVTLRSGEVVHLDLAWPNVQLAVEPGHSWWHGGDLRSRADQARDNACGEVGWQVMRYDEEWRTRLGELGAEVRATYETRRRQFSC
jgi:Transcriptional regulator, AbiEi antitoxin